MSVDRTLIIQSKTDTIRARMEVREAARLIGLDTRDQALISLATSSLIDGLGWGTGREAGTITIESLNGEKKRGLQVIYTLDNTNNNERVMGLTKSVRWMVDTLDVRDPVGDRMKIAMIKWAA